MYINIISHNSYDKQLQLKKMKYYNIWILSKNIYIIEHLTMRPNIYSRLFPLKQKLISVNTQIFDTRNIILSNQRLKQTHTQFHSQVLKHMNVLNNEYFDVRTDIKTAIDYERNNYSHTTFVDKKSLANAVKLYLKNMDKGKWTYGKIDHWDVSQVNCMEGLFEGTMFNDNINITLWDVSGVKNMSAMFKKTYGPIGDLSYWNTLNVEYMNRMFLDSENVQCDVSLWNTSKVESMSGMFENASWFNGDISQWDVSNVSHTNDMFAYAKSFNRNIGHWNVESFRSSSGMFKHASSFNQDISQWNFPDNICTRSMFEGARNFNRNIDKWKMHPYADTRRMLEYMAPVDR